MFNNKTTTKRPDKDNRAERTRRPPVNGKGDILKVEGKDPNRVYRIFNDTGTRLQQQVEYGWDIVSSEEVKIGTRSDVGAGTRASITVDRTEGTQGVVMSIPKEWYEEDQRAKQDKIDEKESQLFKQDETQGNYGKVSND